MIEHFSHFHTLDSAILKKKKNNSFKCLSSQSVSPEKVEGIYKKSFVKNKLHLQSNIIKYKSHPYSKPIVTRSSKQEKNKQKYPHFLSGKKLLIQQMQRAYNMFKTINNSLLSERPKHIKLQPIVKTTRVKQIRKTISQQIQSLKHRNIESRNSKLDVQIKQDGKSAPLRLVLSNKIRTKIVTDLINNNPETTINVQNILQRQSQHEWLSQFQQLKNSLDLKQTEVKRKHKKQLTSRSTYNNAYYMFMALDQKHRQNYLKNVERIKQQKNLNKRFFKQTDSIKKSKQHLNSDSNSSKKLFQDIL